MNTVEQEQINNRIEAHQRWLSSENTKESDRLVIKQGEFLTGFAFDGGRLEKSFFQNALIANTDFGYSTLNDSTFNNANMEGASLRNTTGDKVNFKNAFMKDSIMSDSCLVDCKFDGANMEHANCLDANFNQSTFVNSLMSNITLKDSSLQGADFTGADLSNADLSNVIITNAIFTNANLYNVTCDETLLENESFNEAIEKSNPLRQEMPNEHPEKSQVPIVKSKVKFTIIASGTVEHRADHVPEWRDFEPDVLVDLDLQDGMRGTFASDKTDLGADDWEIEVLSTTKPTPPTQTVFGMQLNGLTKEQEKEVVNGLTNLQETLMLKYKTGGGDFITLDTHEV